MSQASVLVVEDEWLISDDLDRTLRRLGYQVSGVVADGQGAIAAALSTRPSVVLMDIKLKGKMDGIDAARVIRDMVDSPIVFLTSHSDDGTIARASEVRPEGYVSKPFVERELRVAIELALHKHEVSRVLATRERWFSATLQSLREGVLTTDERLAVSFLNGEAERLTGWAAKAAVGRPVGEILRVVDAAGALVPARVGEVLAGGEPVSTDGPLLVESAASGARVPVDHTVAPIVGPGGRPIGTVVVFRDVTERRELERRLARNERLVALGTMAAGICHEINNPLAVVLGNLDLGLAGLRREGSSSTMLDSLTDAAEAAQRIADIVRAMRTFARPGEVTMGPVSMVDVLEQALGVAAPQLRDRVTVERRFDAGTPRVVGNATQLVQVFTNLLVNAAQASEPGRADPRVVVSLGVDRAGQVVAAVEDHGVGIAPEVVARVFDPFFSTKGPGGGMGLGLAISHGIVEAHGGHIEVASEPGVGTTFRVTLPPAAPRSPGASA